MVPVLIFDTPESVAGKAVEAITGLARASVEEHGYFTVALAGGHSPIRMYEKLAEIPEHEFPWDCTQVYFTDERCVPSTDPESNYGMVERVLLSKLIHVHPEVHRIIGEHPDPIQAAIDYEKLLPQILDLIILGIGEDGHTASIFPYSTAIHESDHSVVVVNGPKPPNRRITITPSVIQNARDILALALGTGKSQAVRNALDPDSATDEVPASLARNGLWLLDKKAASLLKKAD